jgi:glycerophosphoryl diester phosphodiesterase
VQGHRGARGLKPEETLPGFEIALDLGVTTLELDLHFTADNQVVVWHDAEIDDSKCGLAAGAPADLPDPDDPLVPQEQLMVRSLTREQLSWYRCDRNPDAARYPDQEATPTALAGGDWRIITLDELFDFVEAYAASSDKTSVQRLTAADVRFNIETKRKPDRPEAIGDGFDGSTAGPFELAILAIVEERSLADRVVIQSFDHRSLWAIAVIEPGIELAALSTRQNVDHADLAARGASIWSPNQEAVNADTLARAHAAGMDVIPWTVNEPEDMEALIALGVDGIITDRPDILLELLTAE